MAVAIASLPIGLRNVGSSCFINAGLQGILAVPTCKNLLQGESETSQENQLRQVMQALSNNRRACRPDEIIDQFYSGQQEDAAEFLNALISRCPKLHSCTQGIEHASFCCRHCSYERPSAVAASFHSMQLHIAGTGSVQSALLRYFSERTEVEHLDDWFCTNSTCLDSGKALLAPVARQRVTSWPQVLQITLKRWSEDGSLDPSRILCNKEMTVDNCHYKLFSIVAHIGATPAVGHYVTYALNNNRWWRFDDQNVLLADQNSEHFCQRFGEKAYLLFYEKISGVDQPPDLGMDGLALNDTLDGPPSPEVQLPKACAPAIDLDSSSNDSDVVMTDELNINFDMDVESNPPNASAAHRATRKRCFGHLKSSTNTAAGIQPDVIDITDDMEQNVETEPNTDQSDAIDAFANQGSEPKRCRLQNLSNFTSDERKRISDVLHSSLTCADACRTLREEVALDMQNKKLAQVHIPRNFAQLVSEARTNRQGFCCAGQG